MKPCIARHPLLSFTLLAYACSWSIAVPLALQAQHVIPSRLPLSLHYLTAFGPAVAAWVTSRALGRSLGSGSGSRSRRLLWLAVGGLSPLALFWAAQLVGLSIGRPVPRWTDVGQVNFLPDLGLAAWLLWLVTSGVGEEVGWRGFALPHLQRTHGALAGSTLLAVIWAGWHVPAFFYVPSYTAIGLRIVPGFFFGVLCGSIVLAWLYNMSGGSVLAVVLWHASFNYVTASPAANGFVAAVVSTSVIVWAGLVVWWFDSATLTQRRTRSIRPTTRERVRQLPGDDLIAPSIGSITHAITIHRRPVDVWQWLAQMGAAGRGGTATTWWITAACRVRIGFDRISSISPSGRSCRRFRPRQTASLWPVSSPTTI